MNKIKIDKYLESLDDHLKISKEKRDYAITRFDIIIITLASSTVLLTLNYISKLKEIKEEGLVIVILAHCILTIFINLVSQITSYYSNKLTIENAEANKDIYTTYLKHLEKGDLKKNEINEKLSSEESEQINNKNSLKTTNEIKIKKLNRATMALNFVSFIALLCSMIILTIFVSFNT